MFPIVTLRKARNRILMLTMAAGVSACGQVLYVATPTPAIEIFDIRSAGNTQQMIRRPGISVDPAIGAPSAMTVVGDSLYVAGGAGVVAQFAIDGNTGALTQRGTVATGLPPYYMDMRPGTLYVGGFGSNDIRVYSIGSNGSLTNLQTVSANGINSLLVDPTRRFVFSGHRASPRLCTFSIQSGGSLNTNPNCAPTPGTPTSLQSSGGVLFALFNTGNSNFVSAWTIDLTTGGLTRRGTDLDIGAANSGSMAVSVDGRTLFVPRQGNFSLVSTGNPMTMSTATFPSTMSPNCQLPPAGAGHVVVNPNGRAFYFTDPIGVATPPIVGRRITAIDLTTGGTLTPITCESTGSIPQALAILAR